MGTTINDIAKAANVSASTVSRVIANNPSISAKTREKVYKIIKEMNYHPNMIARSLANSSTNIIGLIVSGVTEKAFEHPFIPEMMRGIISAAHNQDYKVLVSSAATIKEEKKIVSDLATGGIVDGIILTTSRVKDPTINELSKMDIPFVVIGRPEEEDRVNWVDNDNFSISYDLTSHLINQGHEKIAFLGVCSEVIVTLDRLEGYKKALTDHGIAVDKNMILEGGYPEDTGYYLMKRLIDSGVIPTGLIASDDFFAFSAIKLLTEHGLTVPNDVAVAGYNNTPTAQHFAPPLTSVEVNAFGLGSNAFKLLYASINSDSKSYSRAIVPAKLVVRESSMK